MSADASIRILALDGIPEIREGDDLGVFIGNAIQRTAGALPLTREDVLVVTQKIVSKAEGAVVDLTTVDATARGDQVRRALRPRPAPDRGRPPRGPTRGPDAERRADHRNAHGFVCANGGIDASNVGPASGSVVTLLPVDPDGSATRIRAAIRARYGVDVPVVMSDSFGRPWRWGIVDVAIGVSGLLPLEDLRGVPDADGRVMKSTVRAVADELASAAELTLGKTAGRPVALVRGASFTRGEATIRDALIPAENDLFR